MNVAKYIKIVTKKKGQELPSDVKFAIKYLSDLKISNDFDLQPDTELDIREFLIKALKDIVSSSNYYSSVSDSIASTSYKNYGNSKNLKIISFTDSSITDSFTNSCTKKLSFFDKRKLTNASNWLEQNSLEILIGSEIK